MQLRSDKKRSREVSLFEPIGTDREGNEINLCDIMEANGRDVLEVLITNQNLGKLGPAFSSCLKERERQVLCMRYGLCGCEEYTQREIARKLGIPQLVVGLTIVAMGTSAPEAAVSINAALKDNASIAIGNVIGSNILNILIILGVTAVIT